MVQEYFRKLPPSILLPNGENVDILTKPGAKAFVEQMGSSFIRKYFPEAARERSRFVTLRGHRKAAAIEALTNWYSIIACLAETAEPSDFQANIPENELRCFILHAQEVFLELKVNSKWIQTADMQKCDQGLFDAMIPLGLHRVFNELMENEKILHTLADVFTALPENKVPSPLIAECFICIANNYFICMRIANMDNETIFSQLESSGVLGQTFRCFLAKPPHPQAIERNLHMLANLQECTGVIRKRLKSGKPTGDIVDDILKRRSRKLHPMVKTRLENFQKIAKVANNRSKPNGSKEYGMCVLCGKSQRDLADGRTPMMRCSRCKAVSYCSKECQTSDWKAHKLICGKVTDSCKLLTDKQKRTPVAMVKSFRQEHFSKIMYQVDHMCTKHNVSKEKLVLELDFYDAAPALRGEFKVGLTDHYINDDRPAEPDWFAKGTGMYKDNITRWLALMKDTSNRITDNTIMCISRDPAGCPNILCVTLPSLVASMTPEAMNAAGMSDIPAMNHITGSSATRHVFGPPPGEEAD